MTLKTGMSINQAKTIWHKEQEPGDTWQKKWHEDKDSELLL